MAVREPNPTLRARIRYSVTTPDKKKIYVGQRVEQHINARNVEVAYRDNIEIRAHEPDQISGGTDLTVELTDDLVKEIARKAKRVGILKPEDE